MKRTTRKKRRENEYTQDKEINLYINVYKERLDPTYTIYASSIHGILTLNIRSRLLEII